MRNKKYRLWKTMTIIIVIMVFVTASYVLTSELWEKIFIIGFDTILIISVLLMLSIFLEVESDRIVVRGVASINKAYDSTFRKQIFMFDDIKDIEVEGHKILRIYLKNGYNVGISLTGYFRKNEIIGLIYEVRAQIKGYEQQYI